MLEKHSVTHILVLSNGPSPPPIIFLLEIVRERLQSFSNNSCVGGSSFKPRYFKDLTSCPNFRMYDESLKVVTTLVNCVVVGKTPCEITPYLYDASLTASTLR